MLQQRPQKGQRRESEKAATLPFSVWCCLPSPPLGSGACLLSSVRRCCLVSSFPWSGVVFFFVFLLVWLSSSFSSFRCGCVLHLFCWVVLLGFLLFGWCCCFSISCLVVLPSFASFGWSGVLLLFSWVALLFFLLLFGGVAFLLLLGGAAFSPVFCWVVQLGLLIFWGSVAFPLSFWWGTP